MIFWLSIPLFQKLSPHSFEVGITACPPLLPLGSKILPALQFLGFLINTERIVRAFLLCFHIQDHCRLLYKREVDNFDERSSFSSRFVRRIAQHDVLGLKISMDDALVVHKLQRQGNLLDDCDDNDERKSAKRSKKIYVQSRGVFFLKTPVLITSSGAGSIHHYGLVRTQARVKSEKA